MTGRRSYPQYPEFHSLVRTSRPILAVRIEDQKPGIHRHQKNISLTAESKRVLYHMIKTKRLHRT